MLQEAIRLVCDACEAAADRCERGWRAYHVAGPRRDPDVVVVCPDCAERLLGDDETPWHG
jgi:hypothetical protein